MTSTSGVHFSHLEEALTIEVNGNIDRVHASRASVVYLISLKQFIHENSILGLQNELCYTRVQYCCQEIQQAENFILFLETVTVLQLCPWTLDLAQDMVLPTLTLRLINDHASTGTHETRTSGANIWLHRLPM